MRELPRSYGCDDRFSSENSLASILALCQSLAIMRELEFPFFKMLSVSLGLALATTACSREPGDATRPGDAILSQAALAKAGSAEAAIFSNAPSAQVCSSAMDARDVLSRSSANKLEIRENGTLVVPEPFWTTLPTMHRRNILTVVGLVAKCSAAGASEITIEIQARETGRTLYRDTLSNAL